MARTNISIARPDLGAARSALGAARTNAPVYRMPFLFQEVGVKHGWDFRNGFTGANGTIIPDIIGDAQLFASGITEGTFYTSGEYQGTFDNSDHYCFVTGDSLTQLLTNQFSALVFFNRSAVASNNAIIGVGRGNGSRVWKFNVLSDGAGNLAVTDDGAIFTTYATNNNVFTVAVGWLGCAITYDNGTGKIYSWDGTTLTDEASTGVLDATTFVTTSSFTIGADYTGAGAAQTFMNGSIGMVLYAPNTAWATAAIAPLMREVNRIGQYI